MTTTEQLSSRQIRIDYPDQDVHQRVSTFLNSRHFPAFRHLNIDVRHGEVTLTGAVQSYYEKQVAMKSCQHVPGVLALVDRISVEESQLVEATDVVRKVG